MIVFLNQKACELNDNNSLFDLLLTQDLANKKGIAVALNNRVIPRAKWNETILVENDKIVVITATQGG